MTILKEIMISGIIGFAAAGIGTVLFINNPSSWFKAAKQVKQKQKIKNNK